MACVARACFRLPHFPFSAHLRARHARISWWQYVKGELAFQVLEIVARKFGSPPSFQINGLTKHGSPSTSVYFQSPKHSS